MITNSYRPYAKVRDLIESLGGSMTFRPGGGPGGVWILTLYGKTIRVPARDRSANALDKLYVSRVESPSTWDDYDTDAELVDGALWKLVALFEGERQMATRGEVQYINPAGLHRNPAFTQMVTVSGPVKTIYIGAQWAVGRDGAMVGKGDLAAQTEQILKNIDACLEAAGASHEHVIHLSIFVAEGQDMRPAIEVGMRWWGGKPNPPMNNVMYVSGFYPADFLISIEAIAVVPLSAGAAT